MVLALRLRFRGQLAQLVRASPLHGEGQRFESSIAHFCVYAYLFEFSLEIVGVSL